MSPRVRLMILTTPGFPRVSGDEPCVELMLYGCKPFSPRERG